jgi:CHAT domain-containing protein
VVVDTGDLGSFAELGEQITAFQPHIVHLSGHGVAAADPASFAFENESGQSDKQPATALAQLFAASGVQCVFISACQAGRAPERDVLGGLAAGLVSHGVPLVIGWSASVLDDVATELAAKFYGAVASGQESVDRALTAARRAVRERCLLALRFARQGLLEHVNDVVWRQQVEARIVSDALLGNEQHCQHYHGDVVVPHLADWGEKMNKIKGRPPQVFTTVLEFTAFTGILRAW